MSLLGIDIGSTGSKVAAYTEEGKKIASAYREYNVHVNDCYAELAPENVWNSVVDCMREVVPECGGDKIKALRL